MTEKDFLRRMSARLGLAGDLATIQLPVLDFARLLFLAERSAGIPRKEPPAPEARPNGPDSQSY